MGESLITRRGGADGLGDYEWIKAFAPWNDTSLLDGYDKRAITGGSGTVVGGNWYNMGGTQYANLSTSSDDSSGKFDDVVAVVYWDGALTFISGVQNEIDGYYGTRPAKFKISTTYPTSAGVSVAAIWYYIPNFTSQYGTTPTFIIYTKPSQ